MLMVFLYQNDESDEEILRLLYYGFLSSFFFVGGGGFRGELYRIVDNLPPMRKLFLRSLHGFLPFFVLVA